MDANRTKLTVQTIIAVLLLSIFVSSYALGAEINANFSIIKTHDISMSKSTENGMLQIMSANGALFTQSNRPFKLKNDSGFVELRTNGKLEAFLLSNYTEELTLIVSNDVDGLVVGAISKNSQFFSTLIFFTK